MLAHLAVVGGSLRGLTTSGSRLSLDLGGGGINLGGSERSLGLGGRESRDMNLGLGGGSIARRNARVLRFSQGLAVGSLAVSSFLKLIELHFQSKRRARLLIKLVKELNQELEDDGRSEGFVGFLTVRVDQLLGKLHGNLTLL